MKSYVFLIAALLAWPLYAGESPYLNNLPTPEAVITVAEPAPDEVVVVVNDNAIGGNHAGLFAGSLLIDPAGSYFSVRGRDNAWHGPTLADYLRYQAVDGLKIRLYRFRLQPQMFATIVKRIREAGFTPPLFCASAVQNLLAEIPPFDAIKRVGWTTPSALSGLLERFTQGVGAIGECQKLDASPC